MKKKKIIIIVASIISFLVLMVFIVSFAMTIYALQPSEVSQYDQKSDQFLTQYNGVLEWKDSLMKTSALRDTFIENKDGVKLHALYLSNDSAKGTAIMVHGYTDCSLRMLPIGKMYYDNFHFNILLPDLQYHGKSEGKSIRMGWLDRLDILQWIDVANNLWKSNTMILHGVSMGGATVMMTSGEELPKEVKAIVDDCGYTSVKDQFTKELKEDFGMPKHPIIDVASIVTKWRFKWNFNEASAVNQVAKCKLPMLFIHGDSDDYVPTSMVYELYEAKQTGSKDLLITEGTAHAKSFLNHPQIYESKIREFFLKNSVIEE